MTDDKLVTLRVVEKESEENLTSQIENDTAYCRTSNEPLYVQFRDELVVRGIDITTTLLWVYDTTDEVQIDGFAITCCSRVYEIDFFQGAMRRCLDVTDAWSDSEYAEEITVATKILGASDT